MPVTCSEGNVLTSWPIERTPAWLRFFGRKPYRQIIMSEPYGTARWTYMDDADLKMIGKQPPRS